MPLAVRMLHTNDGGGALVGNWRQISRTLDLFALAEFLTRPPENLFFGKAVELIRAKLHRGRP